MKKFLIVLLILLICIGGYFVIFKKDKVKELVEKVEEKSGKKKEEEKPTPPPEWAYLIDDNGIFSKYYGQAYSKLKEMTVDEKIGQLFLVRVPETNQIERLSQYYFGGYILFDRDFRNKTRDGLINTIKSYQEASKIPLIIASDEEGGTVTRISRYSSLVANQFLSPQVLYRNGGMDAIINDTKVKSTILNNYGINVNLAPVADVSTDPNDFIYQRSFGMGPEETADYVKTVINTSKDYNVSYVLKHFPGYGNNKDTHTGISRDERTLEYLNSNDFVPFKVGIGTGAEAVLVNHNIMVNIEDGIPASLSSRVHEILRKDLKFTGVIMTDDIAMAAIANYEERPSVRALLAGNDMIIISDYERGISEIKAALESGEITEEMIDRAVMRTLAWKYYKGLM